MSLSVVERIEKHKRIFVRNMTTNPSAIVVCHFRVPGRDKPHVLKIPPGPYPYEIFPGRLPESALREGSEELIRFVETGVLRYVAPKKAQEILANPKVKEEVRATFSRANSDVEQRRYAQGVKRAADAGVENVKEIPKGYVSGPGRRPQIAMNQSPLQDLLNAHVNSTAPSRAQHQLAIAGVSNDVNPKVLGLMASYMPDRDTNTLRQLKSMQSSLTITDYNLIGQRAGQGSACGIWAAKQLRRVTAPRVTAPAPTT
jgi:hypothetical protein